MFCIPLEHISELLQPQIKGLYRSRYMEISPLSAAKEISFKLLKTALLTV